MWAQVGGHRELKCPFMLHPEVWGGRGTSSPSGEGELDQSGWKQVSGNWCRGVDSVPSSIPVLPDAVGIKSASGTGNGLIPCRG